MSSCEDDQRSILFGDCNITLKQPRIEFQQRNDLLVALAKSHLKGNLNSSPNHSLRKDQLGIEGNLHHLRQ
ncbi:hypothetical protein C4D60_Mb02t14240 [Musa balbisiana]|uniref:Uncharacterized protein n=1 Tax=Musa balbisiana TaxID=52838 RepID=A0A4S8IAL6_MUSBA|nr:hypothetical protein C4D60_Mb02t14240 [Musa balbisiana]